MDDETRCVTKAKVSFQGYDSLAVPVCRASTIPFPDAEAYATRFERGEDSYTYGLYGTPTHRFLERKITELEQGARTVLTPSGQAAVALAMLSVLKAGDRVLIPDSVYPPVRGFADHELRRIGVRPAFYDPSDTAALEAALDEATRLVWVESPGSTTMEVQDLPRIVALARRRGILVGCDNTWATPLYCKPLAHGADIVVEALSKYLSGHSDVLMGSITVRNPEFGASLKETLGRIGIGVSPDDCSLVLRGLETLAVRLERSARLGEALARWIAGQPMVERVLHPALEDFPGHALWRRDFAGASGVFGIVLKAEAVPHVPASLDLLETIVIGASWGGTKSLLAPMTVKEFRTAKPWNGPDPVLRLSVGLESEASLKHDLESFFSAVSERAGGGRTRVDGQSFADWSGGT